MLLFKYHMLVTTVQSEEIPEDKYCAYGIALKDHSEVRIPNISEDKEFVSNLVKLCNSFQVSPIHFENIIQDAITQYNEERLQFDSSDVETRSIS